MAPPRGTTGARRGDRARAPDDAPRRDPLGAGGAGAAARRAQTFRDCLLSHPLLIHLVRRLIWLRQTPGAPDISFRVMVHTPVDAAGDPVQLPDGVEVGLAHPLLLSDAARARWTAAFTDEHIEQPFPQLLRETFAWSEQERGERQLRRFEGRQVPGVGLFVLDRRGWEKRIGEGRIDGYRRPLAGGAWIHLPLAPGIPLDRAASAPAQELGVVTLGGAARFGELHPVEFSEVVRDLALL